VNLCERAYNSFTDKLLSRDLVPGQFVTQRELAEITGIPMSTIRAIVFRSEVDGLLKTAPNRGLQIASIDLRFVKNAFEFREILEKKAVEAFVRSAPQSVFDQMRRDHEDVLDAASGDVGEALIKRAQIVDWRLHETVIDALKNDIVSSTYRINFIKIRLIRQEQTSLTPRTIIDAMKEHLQIIDMFEKRDVTAAVEAIGSHIETARVRALGLSDGDRGMRDVA
jgi:DNA-binding GntR family transcriptional regulator